MNLLRVFEQTKGQFPFDTVTIVGTEFATKAVDEISETLSPIKYVKSDITRLADMIGGVAFSVSEWGDQMSDLLTVLEDVSDTKPSIAIVTAYTYDQFLTMLGLASAYRSQKESILNKHIRTAEDKGIYKLIGLLTLEYYCKKEVYLITECNDTPVIVEVKSE